MSNTNLNDAIAQAAEAAEAASQGGATQETLPATQPQNTQVATAQPAGVALTMDNIQTAGMSVEEFLKLGDDFVTVGGVKYESLNVHMLLKDASQGGSFQPFVGLNYEIIKGQYKYTKTYDGVRVSEGDHVGKNWQQHVQDIQNQVPTAKPFQGFNVFLVVAEDTKPMKKDEKVLPAGTILGFSTTVMSSKTVLGIWQRGQRDARLGDTAVVKVQGVGRENASKQKYNTMVLEFLHYLEDQAEG